MKLHELRPKHVVESWRKDNDGTRTLLESAMVREVEQALIDWKKSTHAHCVLIGGVALSYHVKPRHTQDADFLFLDNGSIPDEVEGFKRHRKGAFEHKKTGVEIEVISPVSINTSHVLVQKVFDTALESDGFKIASKEGLIALKLNRFSRQDQADIEQLVLAGGKLDRDEWPISDENWAKYQTIAS